MRRMKLVYTFMAAVASKKHPLYTDRFSSIQQLLYDVLDFYVCFIPFLLFSHSFSFPLPLLLCSQPAIVNIPESFSFSCSRPYTYNVFIVSFYAFHNQLIIYHQFTHSNAQVFVLYSSESSHLYKVVVFCCHNSTLILSID